MYKTLLIALKDLTLAFRDLSGLLFMLAAPFALTIGIGMVTGRFSNDDDVGIRDVGVVIVDADDGELGQRLTDTFMSAELAELLEPVAASTVAEARREVDEDRAAAAVIVPAGFSAAIQEGAEPVEIEVYANPERPVSAGVVRAIVDRFVSQVEIGRVAGGLAVEQLLATGRITPDQAAEVGLAVGQAQAEAADGGLRLTVSDAAGRQVEAFDVLAVIGPGFALMFLMATVSNAARTIILERMQGTLPRLLVAPLNASQVLGGKLLGIVLIGAAQVAILVVANAVLFGVNWGGPLPVVLLILACAASASGWGAILAALANNPTQVGGIGSALMLLFGILGGSLGNVIALPDWLVPAAWLTPNYWGIRAFEALGSGATLTDIAPNLGVLLAMAVVLFGIAVVLFRRRGLV
jgi:ABC-2 type transport system permease protein